jgi:hypothetical protein
MSKDNSGSGFNARNGLRGNLTSALSRWERENNLPIFDTSEYVGGSGVECGKQPLRNLNLGG